MLVSKVSFARSSLLLGLLTLVGCGGDGVKTVPVEGTVMQNGKPLERVMVEFWPESEGTRSFATTDEQGHFVLQTDDGKQEGATIGSHKIVMKDLSVYQDRFLGRGEENVNVSTGKKSRIAGAYSFPNSTPLTLVVESGKDNVFAIEPNPR